MYILNIKSGMDIDAVAIIKEEELNNLDLVRKLVKLEAEYKKVSKDAEPGSMFEIVEIADIRTIEANRILAGKTPLAPSLTDYIKQLESEIAKLAKAIEAEKAKKEAEKKSRPSYAVRVRVEEYANQDALDNGYPD